MRSLKRESASFFSFFSSIPFILSCNDSILQSVREERKEAESRGEEKRAGTVSEGNGHHAEGISTASSSSPSPYFHSSEFPSVKWRKESKGKGREEEKRRGEERKGEEKSGTVCMAEGSCKESSRRLSCS